MSCFGALMELSTSEAGEDASMSIDSNFLWLAIASWCVEAVGASADPPPQAASRSSAAMAVHLIDLYSRRMALQVSGLDGSVGPTGTLQVPPRLAAGVEEKEPVSGAVCSQDRPSLAMKYRTNCSLKKSAHVSTRPSLFLAKGCRSSQGDECSAAQRREHHASK